MSIVIMHEGASGSGKSEMLEEFHRQQDGRLKLATNIITGETYSISITDSSTLYPITDDMSITHPKLQVGTNKLVVQDAENGWFMRVDHITQYGTDQSVEHSTIHPKEPILFLNLEAKADTTCLIWEHKMDSTGEPCANPRIILPRTSFKGIVNEPVEVDVRSFGIRTPPCTKENPDYGIIGMFHVLPPALAWIWRLVSPRGFNNPSVMNSAQGLQSEGVGSFWPFSTGKLVDLSNILLEQMLQTLSTRYILIPNQHIGAYHVGFSGQWATREYLSRKGGAKFKPEQLIPSRCSILGYSPSSVKIDGANIAKGILQVNYQIEVGDEAYDIGSKMLTDFFKIELEKYLQKDLLPLGRQIIEACLNDAGIEEFDRLIYKK